jgi:hypothetical protein
MSKVTGRLAAVLAGLALAAGVLAGCSAASSGGGEAGSAVDDAGGQAEQPQTAGEAASEDRSVVIEGTMSMVVDDVAKASDAAARIATDAGGRIDGRDESVYDGSSSVQLVLRIPVQRLEAALADLRELGDVESLQTTSLDVTDSLQDTDSRVSALQATIERLTQFQQQAGSIKDLIALEEGISTRQADLERLLAQRADLTDRTSFSTLTVVMGTSPVIDLPAPATFGSGLETGWGAFTAFIGGLLVVLGVLLPWIGAAAVVAAIVIPVVRWLRRRRPPAVPPQAPPVYASTLAPPDPADRRD